MSSPLALSVRGTTITAVYLCRVEGVESMPRMTQLQYNVWLAKHIPAAAGTPDDSLEDEGKFHDEIIHYLRRQAVMGIIHSRLDRKSTVQVGVPDLIFAFHGVPVALEAKVRGRKPTPEQRGWLKALEMDGWVVSVVRSMKDVQEALDRAKARTL